MTTRCIFCGSDEVTYNSAVKDDYCAECGRWQDGETVPLTENNGTRFLGEEADNMMEEGC